MKVFSSNNLPVNVSQIHLKMLRFKIRAYFCWIWFFVDFDIHQILVCVWTQEFNNSSVIISYLGLFVEV